MLIFKRCGWYIFIFIGSIMHLSLNHSIIIEGKIYNKKKACTQIFHQTIFNNVGNADIQMISNCTCVADIHVIRRWN